MLFIFLFSVCVKLQVLIKNGLILNIRKGKGLGRGWDSVFKKNVCFFGGWVLRLILC